MPCEVQTAVVSNANTVPVISSKQRGNLASLVIFVLMLSTNCERKNQIVAIQYSQSSIITGPVVHITHRMHVQKHGDLQRGVAVPIRGVLMYNCVLSIDRPGSQCLYNCTL